MTTNIDALSIVTALIKRTADAKGISDETITQWLQTPDWQQFLADVRAHDQSRLAANSPQLLTPALLHRLTTLIKLEGTPLESARQVRITDTPPTSTELEPYHGQIDQYLNEAAAGKFIFDRNPTRFPTGAALADLPNEQRLLAVRACIERLLFAAGKLPAAGPTLLEHNASTFEKLLPLNALLNRLLRANLSLTEKDLANLLALIHGSHAFFNFASASLPLVINAIEHFSENHDLPLALTKPLARIEQQLLNPKHSVFSTTPTKEARALAERIARLLGHKPSTPTLDAAEPWSAALARTIFKLPPNLRPEWDALLRHLNTANGSKPSQKWLKMTKFLIPNFGEDRLVACLTEWLPLVAEPRTDLPVLNHHAPDPNYLLSEPSQQALKGLAWAASLLPHPEVATALGDLGVACFKKITWLGPRCKTVGNAVLWSLSALSTSDAVAQLTRISSKLKHASARTMADKAFQRASETTGQTREDLEEISLPTFDLSPDSTLTKSIANFTITLAISPAANATLTITDANNKPLKAAPPALKSHPDYKALQKHFKNLTATLAAQKHRIERLFLLPDRTWSFPDWKSRYLDHPLLAPFTRRLIWQFTDNKQTTTAIPQDGKLLRPDNSQFITHNSEFRIQLWHPSTSTPEEVRAWRTFLANNQIAQPFKQAHREIYLLTDAERQTDTHSNRFAGHIIRQQLFAALCAQRGWTYRLMGSWDGHNTPTLHLPNQNLKVEFWVEQTDDGPDMATTELGISTVLATDQVRFYNADGPAPQMTRARLMKAIAANPHNARELITQPDTADPLIPLANLHPQLFSEIMRDVDLLIAVASIANDPNWNATQNHHTDYWHAFSFGDLTPTAQTRKEILASLLPRLAIAPQCTLSEKFLIIKGALRTYKIHLGSANILMEPNDQYLCIVPDRSPKSPPTLHLPFEGDTTLSVILSKAFLLANDKKITDPSILRQITP